LEHFQGRHVSAVHELIMHEKILQGVTVGVVAGLFVYWMTSKHTADRQGQNTGPSDYKPLYGDVRTIRNGSGTCACCQCCGLVTPQNVSIPLASDYLCGAPAYAPSISKLNLGISLQLSCEGIDLHSCITRKETGTSFPYGVKGPNTNPRPIRVTQQINCHPDVCVPVCCTEVI
jgi:hypothetical protein